MKRADGAVLEATRRLLEATSNCTGDTFFRALAATTAQVLGFRYGLVGRVVGDHVRTLAVWNGERYVEDFEYALDGTPCAQVIERSVCYVPFGVQAEYPRDELLAQMGVESYTGLHIRGACGDVSGVLAALHDAPTAASPDIVTILELFASRAAVELERADTDARLRESEARYRTIVTTCGEGVWTIDAQGATTFVNAQMAQMFGMSPEELVGKTIFELTDDEGRRIAERNLGRRARGVGERHDFRFVRKDGAALWTTLSTTPLYDEQGRFAGALALVTDITERRALEHRVQQTQKLESLGVLAGGIAHDFNNLLVGILGNVGLVMPSAAPESPDRAALEDIETAAHRAADLVRQLLAYAGRSQLVLAPVDLGALVAETQQLLSSVVSKRAALRVVAGATLPAVEGDPTQLRQVVMNLITNASDALDDRDGAITLTTRVVDVDRAELDAAYGGEQLAAGEYVALEVSDTGSGMSPATQTRMFDPFFTTKATGRGLGLASVLGILRAHRGAIRVVSTPGHGSTFTVLLPVASGHEPSRLASSAGPQASAASSGTILVVDDEPMVAATLRRTLEMLGYDVLVAADGRAGLEAFEAHPEIRVVLLDLSLPRMSGAEVFRAMRAMRPDARVVLCSGYDRDDAAARVGEGLAGVLQKPWTLTDLTDVIARALS